MKRVFARASLALLITALGGCSLLVAPPSSGIENRCGEDADCVGGVCDVAHQMCVVSEPPRYALRLEVTPMSDPLGGVPVPILVDVPNFDDGFITLPVTVPVNGTVRYRGAPVAAEITFTAAPTGDARMPILSGGVAARSTAALRDVDFSTQLPAGATYDVSIEPLGEFRAQLPPIRARLIVPADAGVSFPIVYEDEALDTTLGSILDGDRVPQAGLIVRGVDPLTGRALTSTATTDAEGRFTLVHAANVTDFAFRVRGDETRQNNETVLPALTISPTTLVPTPDGEFVLLVPSSNSALRFVATVEMPGARALPAVGARIRFTSSNVRDVDTGLTGSIELDRMSDAAGRFEGWVLPGDYRVEIVPAEEAAAVLAIELEIAANPTGMLLGQVFTLPSRAVLGGTTQLVDGEPVSATLVRANALGLPLSTGEVGATRLNRSGFARTGSLGEFRLPLDIGVYDLVVEMPAATNFAWHVVPSFGVGSASTGLRQVIAVRPPYRHEGTLVYADGDVAASASIRLFAVDRTTGRAIEVGACESDEMGRFVALLPASISAR